ncbi:MAG: nucleotide pyrophosphohydrolase [Simkaniaceae bacterium]|nr:nucleotide pyrophosphohydrolase [Simkaniaceae bacterium]
MLNGEAFTDMKVYLDKFISDRGWDEFRNPKNLVMALSVETAELTEIFQWLSPDEAENVKYDLEKVEAIEEEMADILSYLIQLAGKLDIDLEKSFWKKTKKNEIKHQKQNIYS